MLEPQCTLNRPLTPPLTPPLVQPISRRVDLRGQWPVYVPPPPPLPSPPPLKLAPFFLKMWGGGVF